MAQSSALRLRIDHAGETRHADFDRLPVIIGRDPACDLVIDDPLVSRHHAEVDRDGAGRLIVRDLGSSNGTYADGVRLTAPLRLTPAIAIRIGRTFLHLAEPVAPVVAAAVVPMADQATFGPAPVAAPARLEAHPAGPMLRSDPSARGSGWPASPAILGGVGAIIVLALIGVAAVAGGWFGGPAPSTAPMAHASSSPAIAGGSPGSDEMSMPASSAMASHGRAASGGGTKLTFDVKIGSVSVGSDTTVTPTVCHRPIGGTAGLVVDYSTSFGPASHLKLTIPDVASASTANVEADVSLAFSGLDRPFTATTADLKSLSVRDSGVDAEITLSMKNAKGDTLSGTITCEAIAG